MVCFVCDDPPGCCYHSICLVWSLVDDARKRNVTVHIRRKSNPSCPFAPGFLFCGKQLDDVLCPPCLEWFSQFNQLLWPFIFLRNKRKYVCRRKKKREKNRLLLLSTRKKNIVVSPVMVYIFILPVPPPLASSFLRIGPAKDVDVCS